MPDPYSVDAYDYELPEELIAQRPAEPRDTSRLLVVDRARGTWEHRVFRDLAEYFGPEDLLIANNTRVIKARLLGKRLQVEPDGTDSERGGVEFMMLERVGAEPDRRWEGLFKASAKYLAGVRFRIPTPDGRGIVGTIVRGSKESVHGTVVVEFDRDPIEADAGELPLPHYILPQADRADETSYQTLYAKRPGSAAAPTAGLHFTPRVMDSLKARGVEWGEVTLDVGLGTFRGVKSADIRAHVMHDERYEVSAETAAQVSAAKARGRRITAVGTTSVRTLESAWRAGDCAVRAGAGRTSIFIYPGEFKFQVVDRLLTNFHLPKSTLLMLVSAFAGRELALAAYHEAVREKYRFFSYGDAMLVL